MIWRFKQVIYFAGLYIFSLTVLAADLYVSTDGKDSQAGTADQPFATLQQALQSARSIKNKPVTIYILRGIYHLTTPITLGAEDGRNKNAPLLIQAKDEDVVFSGGQIINGWKVGEDGIWRTTIDAVKNGAWKFNELFVNGRRATRARFPNYDYLRIEKVGEDKRTSFTYKTGDLPKFDVTHETELVFLHDWSISRVRIAAIEPESQTVHTASNVGPAAPHYSMDHFEPHPRYFLENNPAFLDAPGEWYLDNATGVLSYKPLPGQEPGKVEVVAPVLTSLLEIKGKPDHPIEYLRLENILFEHCAYDYGERYAAGQATYHEEIKANARGSVPAAITIDDAGNVGLNGIQVAHVGGTGVWIDNRNKDIDISNMHVEDSGGNGLMIGDPTYTKVGENFAPVTTRVHVSDSVFEKVGQRFFGAVGVWIGMSNYITFEHNLVRFTPYTGISVGWRWDDTLTPIHDIAIAHNLIHHNMQILSDGGGIYTLGRMPNSKIIGNVIHDIPPNAGNAESNGIFFDAGTSYLRVENNVVYNIARAPLRFNQAKSCTTLKNLLVYPPDQTIYRYTGMKDEDIAKIVKQDDRPIRADQFHLSDAQALLQSAGPR